MREASQARNEKLTPNFNRDAMVSGCSRGKKTESDSNDETPGDSVPDAAPASPFSVGNRAPPAFAIVPRARRPESETRIVPSLLTSSVGLS